LAGTMPEKVKELHALLIAWRAETGAIIIKSPGRVSATGSSPR
jgi:hypothetical protein